MAPQRLQQTSRPKCGISKASRVTARVVEGTRTVPGKWPWQVNYKLTLFILQGSYRTILRSLV